MGVKGVTGRRELQLHRLQPGGIGAGMEMNSLLPSSGENAFQTETLVTRKKAKTALAMPTDGAHAKFLYTILKQLDLKSIDWNLVASQLDITNGHAARMRFSRFKQHMEGVVPGTRRRAGSVGGGRAAKRSKGEKSKKGKKEKEVAGGEKEDDDPSAAPTAEEEGAGVAVKPEPFSTISVYSAPATTYSPTIPPLRTQNPFGSETGECQTIAPYAQMVAVEEPQESEDKKGIIVKVEPWEEED
ncbi:MAG: hypothetical protein M1839_009210 [Geoglossum umbratile]|nr:MAG: hypothetical protein M1839_009210 [Geoglossum umbratile]